MREILSSAGIFLVGLIILPAGSAGPDAPKTATLSFVTDEVDGWHTYLKSKGLTMRAGMPSALSPPWTFLPPPGNDRLFTFRRLLSIFL
jgi:hypothetical protein